jgi:hypothetical protein
MCTKKNSNLNVSENEELFLSPEWHGSILDKRESLVNSGQAAYIELSQMKKDIHDAIEPGIFIAKKAYC